MASQTKKITLDTAALFFGRAVGLLLGIVRLNYLATYLGVANFGILNFATYFTALFQSLFDLGMSQLMTREISREPSRGSTLLGQAVILKLIIVVVASLIVGVFTFVSGFDSVTNWAIVLTTVTLSINGITSMFLSAFQAHRKMVTVSIANIANDAIISAAIILMMPAFPSVLTALGLTVVVSLINLGFIIRVYFTQVGRPSFGFNRESWTALLREGRPLAISSAAISVYAFIGPTILKFTRGDTEVGIYSAGYKLISILTLIPATASQIAYPIFSNFSTNSPSKLNKSLADALRVMFLVSAPLAIGTYLLSPKIMALLYPESFASGGIVLQLIILGSSVGYLAQVLWSFLLATDKQRFCMANALVVALGVILAGLVFIPRFGYPAVAAIWLATDIWLFLALASFAARCGFIISRVSTFLRITLAALLMGAIVFLIRDSNLFLSIAVGSVVYLAALFPLHVFGDQETEILNKLLKGRLL
jgi:O-antigen/teichoic acid export membrane protein